MNLEHRWSKRKSVCLDVVIFYRPLGLLRGTILDVSLEGVFVDTGHVALPPNAMVEVTFALEGEEQQQLHQIKAIVVHCGNGGYGLMFLDFKLGAFQAIRDMLYIAA